MRYDNDFFELLKTFSNFKNKFFFIRSNIPNFSPCFFNLVYAHFVKHVNLGKYIFFLNLQKKMMALNRTFTMIKPDAVKKGYIGPILNKINVAGFKNSFYENDTTIKKRCRTFLLYSQRPTFF